MGDDDKKRDDLRKEYESDPDDFSKKWGTDAPPPPSPTTPRKPDGTPAN